MLSATGGSTNEFIHLVAIAGRLGISLGLDRFAAIGERTPQVLGVRPSGRFSLEDFDRAGGVPALLAVLEPLLDSGCVLGDGSTASGCLRLFLFRSKEKQNGHRCDPLANVSVVRVSITRSVGPVQIIPRTPARRYDASVHPPRPPTPLVIAHGI